MDISNITDLDKLKSMAYDEIAKKEAAEGNLRVINARISQLATAAAKAETDKKPKKETT